MVKNNKIIVAIIAIIFLNGCKSSNNESVKNDINAFVVENSNRWESTLEVDTLNCTTLYLYMLNNPYQFDKNKIILYMDDKIIYKGFFKKKLRVHVSNDNFGKRVVPSLTVFKGTTEYNFIQKLSCHLSEGDKFIYIVFCPENDLAGSCYLFSQKEEIL